MERYKVKLPTDDAFGEALTLIEGEIPLFVCSRKRRSLSVGSLTPELERQLVALGGRVTVEQRYELEVPTGV